MVAMAAERTTFTVEQVAEILQINPRTVARMIERGEIRGIRAGRLWRISAAALDAYLEGRHSEPEEGAE
jgi:excisionase family DNA binding protein